MKSFLPVFYEIIVEDTLNEELRTQLEIAPIQESPVYIQFAPELKTSEIEQMCDQVKAFIIEKGFSPQFPYPVYLVVPPPLVVSDFPFVHHLRELPSYFKKLPKRLSSQEEVLFDKCQLLKYRFSKIDIVAKLKHLHKYAKDNHELSAQIKIGSYYESILREFKE